MMVEKIQVEQSADGRYVASCEIEGTAVVCSGISLSDALGALAVEIGELFETRTRIVEVVGHHTKLWPIGTSGKLEGPCPIHQGSFPTLVVDPVAGAFYCFTCGAGGGPDRFLDFIVQQDD